ncbi:MAG: 4-hydroxy-tetrahydrodipicolinate synthase [Planctomycetes bacterium]|nr:4-hydroxy-tetrahydrodipicolinate synthase [Planctomycetota bacterium]
MSSLFHGLSVALATPFQDDGSIDVPAFRRLVRHVACHDSHGGANVLVVLGSTGEAAALDDGERDELVDACLEEAQGLRVVAGTGHSSTRQAARWTARAQRLGVAGALVVTPPYVKPVPAGLRAHYAAIADEAPGLPLIVYNVPGRTGTNLAPDVLASLWANPSVVAVKESSGNLEQIGRIAAELPEGKTLLAGDDSLALASIAVGASGLVSVAGNVAPRAMAQLVAAARSGDLERAREIDRRLRPLVAALFVESNPIPLKAALAELGIAKPNLRLPLTAPEAATRKKIAQALATVGEEVHA